MNSQNPSSHTSHTWLWIVLGIIIVIAIIITIILVVHHFEPPHKPFSPPPEKYLDTSISTPTQQLYLSNFQYNPNLNTYPWCVPTWYAIRYVRVSDGGYSQLGPWTPTTSPVQSGNTSLPCYDTTNDGYTNNCTFTTINNSILVNPDTCNFNQVTIGTPSPLTYSIEQGYYANIHRQSGTFNPDSQGMIIGILTPDTGTFVGSWEDVLYPPNTQDVTCSNCT